jgi:hypothetical protein
MRIQVIDILQPPGIGMLAIDAIEAHHSVVISPLAANSNAAAAMKRRSLCRAAVAPTLSAEMFTSAGNLRMTVFTQYRYGAKGLCAKLVAHNARVGVTNLTGMAWTR